MGEYLWGKIRPRNTSARLEYLRNVSDDFELLEGVSRIKNWSKDTYFNLNKLFPENIELDDFVWNYNSLLVVSEKVKDVFSEISLNNIEYLPVKIKDFKGVNIKTSYYIMNFIKLQDCLDLEQSEVVYNKIDPNRISIVRKMVINETMIIPDTLVFRMKRSLTTLIFHKDLIKKIKENNLKGLIFGKIEDWKSR